MSPVTHEDGIPLLTPGVTPTSRGVLPPEYYSRFLSHAAQTYRANPSRPVHSVSHCPDSLMHVLVRGLFPLELVPGVISLLAGKPNPSVFPLAGLTLSAREPGAPVDAPLATLPLETGHLAEGLQYGAVAGWQPFLDWVTELQRREHGRDLKEGWGLTSGLGSNDLIYKAIHAIVNPGEPVLIESPTFAYVQYLL